MNAQIVDEHCGGSNVCKIVAEVREIMEKASCGTRIEEGDGEATGTLSELGDRTVQRLKAMKEVNA